MTNIHHDKFSYFIRPLPACTGWSGIHHPACFEVRATCNLGMRWDCGEFATHEEAQAYINARIKKVAA